MDIADIKKRYDYDKLDGDFYEAVYCGDPIQRVEDLRWLIVEVERYKNIVKSKSPRKWEITNWIDRCNKAEAEVEQLQAVFDMQQTRMGKATKLWQQVTGTHHTLPDLGVLLDWLMDRTRR